MRRDKYLNVWLQLYTKVLVNGGNIHVWRQEPRSLKVESKMLNKLKNVIRKEVEIVPDRER